MKRNLSLTYLLILLISQTALTQSLSQSLFGTTGSFMSTSGYSVSYTVGELAIRSQVKSGHFLTQGFQQSYLDTVSAGDTIQTISVNPNPVSSRLNIDFYISGSYDFSLEVYNLKGRKIMHIRYPDLFYKERKTLDLQSLPKGMYLIRIYSINGKVSKMFKIEKL